MKWALYTGSSLSATVAVVLFFDHMITAALLCIAISAVLVSAGAIVEKFETTNS